MAANPTRPRTRSLGMIVFSGVGAWVGRTSCLSVTLHSLFLVRFLSVEETGGLFDARGAQVATRGPTGRCFLETAGSATVM